MQPLTKSSFIHLILLLLPPWLHVSETGPVFFPPSSRPQSVLHAGLPSVSTQLTAFNYLPNTVDTSMPPLDICHLKQTALIRSSTKCKYQSGPPRRTTPKNTSARGRGRCPSALIGPRAASFSSTACRAWAPGLPELRQLTQTQTRSKGPFLSPPFVGSEAYTLSVWRLAKHSSDECESAATDVHTQFLGLNLCLLKNCVWTISR